MFSVKLLRKLTVPSTIPTEPAALIKPRSLDLTEFIFC